MARYLTSSRKQREAAERRQRKLRSNRRGRRCSSSPQDTEATSSGETVDTRRRRNPRLEVRRDADMAAHQLQLADVNEDRFYVIEKLLKKRNDANGNEQYLVRWQNYPPDYDSWEPREELEKNALDMIHQFNRLHYPTDCQPDDLHCICRKPYKFNQGGMIQCYECQTWYHFTCLNMNMIEANSYARYYCECCRQHNSQLKNIIKHDKVSTLYGNSTMTRVESDDGIFLQP